MDAELYRLAERLGQQLRAAGLRVATAESCTGGAIAAAITAVPGSSGWFDCGFISYSNQAKQRLLDVPAQTLQQHGAVSGETVAAMLQGALRHSDASLAVAVSGIAGPDGGSADKPVGTVWIAWGGTCQALQTRCFLFAGDRHAIQRQTVLQALQGLLAIVATAAV